MKECLRLNKIRYRTHVADLPGMPDFANKTRKFAIFVQGCFWHSHEGCALASQPKSNQDYWRPKLKRNRERDAANYAAIQRLGFRILVVWECETRRDGALAAAAVSEFFCSK
jgi:DNA mismatch endonuclease (patch repair protein)